MRVGVETTLTAGHLTFTNLELSQYTGDAVISRSSYSVAGQRIAVKVAGDPVSGNNGLFFVYTDHLGSSSILSDLAGTAVAGSEAHYLPFGGYRGSAPTQTLTDRGYTGQKENLDLGLMYYNARYYIPGLGKFASADTLVPDPANPQAFNRYAYVLNNPIIFIDPDGHEPIWCGYSGGSNDSACTPPPPNPILTAQILDATVQIQVDGVLSHGVLVNSNTILTHNHFDDRGLPTNLTGKDIHIYDASGNVICSPCSYTNATNFNVNGVALDLKELHFTGDPFSGRGTLPFANPNASAIGGDIAVVNGVSGGQTQVVWTTVIDTAYVTRWANPVTPYNADAKFSGLQVDHFVLRGASGGAAVMIIGGQPTVVGIMVGQSSDGASSFVTFSFQ